MACKIAAMEMSNHHRSEWHGFPLVEFPTVLLEQFVLAHFYLQDMPSKRSLWKDFA